MKLLENLYSIHSTSGCEKKIKRFIKRHVLSVCPDVEIEYDNAGNMYITKGKSETYPCIVAHLDQVQRRHSSDFQVVVSEDIICAFSLSQKMQQGLGADDKNGLWIALKCLEKYDVLKVAFFVSEEIGCIGSSSANMSFFNDARFVIEPDRRGSSDLITDICYTQLCSTEFLMDIGYEAFGYKPTNGMMTDVLVLKENGLGVSCINISCGYYEPHTDNEFTCIPDLMNALHFVENIIETCTKVYPHEDTFMRNYYASSQKYNGLHNNPGANNRFMWDDMEPGYERNNDDIEPLKFSDYMYVEDYINDLIARNPLKSVDKLWDYASSELEAIGVSYNEFCELANELDTY